MATRKPASHPRAAGGGWVFGLVVAGFVVVNVGMVRGPSSFASYSELGKRRDVMSKTVGVLRHENAELRGEIQRLLRSPSYARKVLRDKYHVTDPDEDIVFFAE